MRGLPPVFLYAAPHFIDGSGTILYSKGAPCHAYWQDGAMGEEPASDYEITRAVELKEERFTN